MRPFLTRGYVTEVKKRFIVGDAMMRNYDVDTFVICRPRTMTLDVKNDNCCRSIVPQIPCDESLLPFRVLVFRQVDNILNNDIERPLFRILIVVGSNLSVNSGIHNHL